MLLIVTSLLVVVTIFSMAAMHAPMSRDEVMSKLVAESVQDEILGHHWGDPEPPAGWTRLGATGWQRLFSYQVLVEGRRTAGMAFRAEVQQSPRGNGSFLGGDNTRRFDELQVTLRWREDAGLKERQLEFLVPLVR